MSVVLPAIRNLARRLIALEAARTEPMGEAARVCDRLRVPLSKLAGVAGFRSLLTRALAMAKVEIPSLNGVHARPDGSLGGFEAGFEGGAEAEVAVVAHLLGLLVTFIGEPLTLGLVRDAWPDAPSTEFNAGSGDSP